MKRLVTENDIEFVREKIVAYKIQKEVLDSLLRCGSCVMQVNDKDEIEALFVGPLVYNSESGVPECMIIAAWSDDKNKITELIHEQAVVSYVRLSRDVAGYLRQKVNVEHKWYDFEVPECKDEIKQYPVKMLERQWYSKEALALREEISKIDADACRDSNCVDFYSELQIAQLKDLEKYGLVDYGYGIYSIPVLTKDACKNVLKQAKAFTYTVNPSEAYPAQIPEAILEDFDPRLHSKMSALFFDIVPQLSKLMYSAIPETLFTIQLAKYKPDNTSQGNWHTDSDSDITLVISLSDSHVGGGTAIKPYGIDRAVIVPQLPAGHALLFRGKHFLHKGLPVESGERNLMVFWSESEED